MQPMKKSDISTLVHFNFWANGRILAACERISTDEFTRQHTPDPGWDSLRGILVHTLDAEFGWRTVLQAQDGDVILQAGDFANVAALKLHWNRERAAWFDYVSRLSEDSIHLRYGNDPHIGLKVWQTIVHVVTHGIHHRSEAAAILTGYGQSPGELDFDRFLQENPDLSST
jgi:uncharacterized damage-inducible protein DinB